MSLALEIKSKINIVDLIREDGILLKPEGIGKWSAKCPFHSEKTPSFKVDETFQRYKCFGCGASGDSISYFSKQHTVDNRTGMLLLAERLNIKINQKQQDIYTKQKRLLDLNKSLMYYYQEQFQKLDENHPIKQEITRRILLIDTNIYGYAPNDKESLLSYLSELGYTIEECLELGIINEKGNLLLSDRLVFFIKNYMGYVTGFSGRTVKSADLNYKYVNSKSSSIYDKQSTLYGIEIAKKTAYKTKVMYIVEGQFDVIAMQQKGLENTVGISGTAFNYKHIQILNKCIGEEGKIILCLDSDKAGLKAMVKIFQDNPSIQSRLYYLALPKNLDPCDFLQHKTPKDFKQPILVIKFLFDKLLKQYPISQVENRQIFLNKLQENVTQYIQDPILKEVYLKDACLLTHTSYQHLAIKQQTSNRVPSYQIEEYHQEIVDKEHLAYLTSLAFYIKNKHHLKGILNKDDYPTEYLSFIEKLNAYQYEIFYPEYFKNTKIAQHISEINVDLIEDKELALSQYQTYLEIAKKQRAKKERLSKVNTVLEEIKNNQTLTQAHFNLLDDIIKKV